jgi:hypothetical protein
MWFWLGFVLGVIVVVLALACGREWLISWALKDGGVE